MPVQDFPGPIVEQGLHPFDLVSRQPSEPVPFVSGVAEAYFDLLQFDMQLGIANRVTRNASKCVCLH
jgi:hypothetical protein